MESLASEVEKGFFAAWFLCYLLSQSFKKYIIYLFMRLHWVSVVARGIFHLRRGTWDLQLWQENSQLWPGTRDRTPVSCIGRWILNHWTTRDVLNFYWVTNMLNSEVIQMDKIHSLLSRNSAQ